MISLWDRILEFTGREFSKRYYFKFAGFDNHLSIALVYFFRHDFKIS